MKVSIGRIVLIVTVTNGQQYSRPAIVVMTHDNDAQAINAQMFVDGPNNALTFASEVRHESAAAINPSEDRFWIWPPRES